MAWAGGVWDDFKEASEGGGRIFCYLEIDTADPDAVLPNTDPWDASRTLRFSESREQWKNSVTDQLKMMDASIKRWGPIKDSVQMGTALTSVPGFQVVLDNGPLQFQEPGSSITGPTALSPEPNGRWLRASEIFRFWKLMHQPVRMMAVAVGGPSGIQDWVDGTPANNTETQVATIFTGVLSNIAVDKDNLILNIASDTTTHGTVIEADKLVSKPGIKNEVIQPIVMGEQGFNGQPSFYLDATEDNRYCGLIPNVTPLTFKGLDSSSYPVYIYTQLNSTNQTTQDDGTAPVFDTMYAGGLKPPYIMMYTDEAPGPGEFTAVESPGSNANTLLQLEARDKYVEGWIYVLCNEVDYESAYWTNIENAVDGKPYTYATCNMGGGGSVQSAAFRLPPIPQGLGTPIGGDEIYAFIVTDDVGASPNSRFKFGIYDDDGAAWQFVSPEKTTDVFTAGTGKTGIWEFKKGAGTATDPTDGTYPGVWTDSGNVSRNLKFEDYTSSSGDPSPGRWVFRLENTNTVSAETLHLIACGLRIKVRVSAIDTVTTKTRVKPGLTSIDGDDGTPLGKKVGIFDHQEYTYETYDITTYTTDEGGFWAGLRSSAPLLDLDHATNNFTGTQKAELKNPITQAAYLTYAWTPGATFASFAATSTPFDTQGVMTLLDAWVTGSTWKTDIFIPEHTELGSAINSLIQHSPCFLHTNRMDGTFYTGGIKVTSPPTATMIYKNADGATAEFHPNLSHEDATKVFNPYMTHDFTAILDTKTLKTGIRVNFNQFRPTGEFIDSVYANPVEQKVWDGSAFTVTPYTDGATSDEIAARCLKAKNWIGQRTREVVFDLPQCHDRLTANAYLKYLVSVQCQPRLVITFKTGFECHDILPGNFIFINNDMNLFCPMPYYGLDDWEDHYFVVTNVEIDPNADAIESGKCVTITGVQHVTL